MAYSEAKAHVYLTRVERAVHQLPEGIEDCAFSIYCVGFGAVTAEIQKQLSAHQVFAGNSLTRQNTSDLVHYLHSYLAAERRESGRLSLSLAVDWWYRFPGLGRGAWMLALRDAGMYELVDAEV